MSTAFFIVLDNEDPGFDTMVNGKFLSQNSEQLGKIAASLGIRKLEDYVSYAPDEARALMEDVGVDPDQIEETEVPEQQWFDAQEGLDVVAKLSDHVRAKPRAVKNAKGVLADLQEFKAVLEKAKGIKARWNLQVDF
ncbi:MAG TPA: hypothetical protein VGY66_18955 [Gemmataceae bacterium]|jgi:hypothetical protein|nr:hypothetical protein [Gemmataceae bacterium]